MADLDGYRAKSASFAAAGITGLTDASVEDSGSPTDVESDADPVIKGVVVDGIAVNATVTTTDITKINSIAIGTAGSLVIVFEKRADGKGAAASPNKTATIADAVVISKSDQAASKGVGSGSITFRAKSVTWS
jgi:hypothetical protein